jgi:hypothetical protein
MDDNQLTPAVVVIAIYIALLTVATYVIKRTVHLAPLHSNTR